MNEFIKMMAEVFPAYQPLADAAKYTEKNLIYRGASEICRKDHYFKTHPGCNKIVDDRVEYPATPDGRVLCAKDAGYTDECNAGEGFFDCRDCWCTIMRGEA